MSDAVIAAPTEVPEDLRLLRTTRALAFCSLLFFLIAALAAAFTLAPGNGAKNLVVVLTTAPVWLPYLWMFLRLSAKTTKSQKKGLALAVSYGFFALIIAAPSALASFGLGLQEGLAGLGLQAGLAIFALLQLALIVSGVKTYYAMEREPDDRRILVRRIVGVSDCLGILTLAAIHVPCLLKSKIAADEASSIGAMRTICTAQSGYAEKHPEKGFAAVLSDLGPPPGVDFIDQQLASGTRSGYTFTLAAAPRDSRGRIAQYTVIARPLTFGASGSRSLFVDASGVIRFTTEDRAPTAQDRPLN